MTEQKQETELTREELLDLVEAQKAVIGELRTSNAAEREKLFKSFLGAADVEENGGEAVEDNDDNDDDWSEDIKKMEQRLINKFKGR